MDLKNPFVNKLRQDFSFPQIGNNNMNNDPVQNKLMREKK